MQLEHVKRIGIVLLPLTGELFTATSEKGATLNNHPIQVSKSKIVGESLLVNGFPYNLRPCHP